MIKNNFKIQNKKFQTEMTSMNEFTECVKSLYGSLWFFFPSVEGKKNPQRTIRDAEKKKKTLKASTDLQDHSFLQDN